MQQFMLVYLYVIIWLPLWASVFAFPNAEQMVSSMTTTLLYPCLKYVHNFIFHLLGYMRRME